MINLYRHCLLYKLVLPLVVLMLWPSFVWAQNAAVQSQLIQAPSQASSQAHIKAQPVSVPAHLLKPFYKASVNSMRVVTYADKPISNTASKAQQHNQLDNLQVIPFQWTQLNVDGQVFNDENGVKTKGDLGQIDAYDRLEFMYTDLSTKPCQARLKQFLKTDQNNQVKPSVLTTPQAQVVEIQVKDRFACVTQLSQQQLNQPQLSLSTKDYVTYEKNLGRATADSYELILSEQNPLIWQDFFYNKVNRNAQGERTGPSILDALKINIDSGVVTPITRVKLNNAHFSSKILAVAAGPIRDSVHALTHVQVTGISVLQMHVSMHFYPSHVEMVTRFKLPQAAIAIVRSPIANVSLDANNIWGGEVMTSWGPQKPFKVNGILEPEEKELTKQQVQGKGSWIWYSTRQGFDLYTFIEFDDTYDVPIALVYQDDKQLQVEPERFPGQGPNIGYSLRDVVIGEYFTFVTKLVFTSDTATNKVSSTANLLQQPWPISVSANTLE